MKTKNVIHYGAGILLLTAGLVSAQDENRPKGPGGDGGGRILEFLKNADTNADGKLSKEEFASVSNRDTDERFARMDSNGDGFVDQAEVGQIAEKMRGMAGKGRPGGPGGPPSGEGGFRRPPEGAGKPEGGRPDGQRPPGGPPDGASRPGGPGGPGGMDPNEVFSRMDANGDGNVDNAEYETFAKREIEERFKRLDGDGNGTVSKGEFNEGMSRLRQMMGGGGRPGGPGGPGAGRGGPPGGDAGDRGGFRRPPEGDAPKRPALESEGDKKPEA